MALPTIGSLMTLRKKAGNVRATTAESNFTNILHTTEAFQFVQTRQQNRERTNTGQTYNSISTKKSSVRRSSGRIDYNKCQPKQPLRRSLRLVEKSRAQKSNQERFSRFFSQSGTFNTDRFRKRFEDLAASSNGISTFFSQPASDAKYFNSNPFFKLDPVSGRNKQSNSHVKRRADSGFKLLPLNSSRDRRTVTTDLNITPPRLSKPTGSNIISNFEAALCKQIKVDWTTDIDSYLSEGLVKAFDDINLALSGQIMMDPKSVDNYARSYHPVNKEVESEFRILDQKIYNNNNGGHGDGGGGGPKEKRRAHPPEAEPSTSGGAWDGGFPLPPARWVYRTPEKKRHQQPRLDDRPSLLCGLIRSSQKGGGGGGGGGGGDVSVYRVNRQFRDRCFVGDVGNVPLSRRVFSHVGDFHGGPRQSAREWEAEQARLRQHQHQQVRYLKVKTSTAQDPESDSVVDLDYSPDLSNIDGEDEYDPFLITRPSKPKSTISRKELFEMKRPLDETETDNIVSESNFLPKKRLFPTETSSSDDNYEECLMLH